MRFCTVVVGPKVKGKCSYKREMSHIRPCDQGGRDWSDGVTSPGIPRATRS
jgi:hypothetical protein